MPCLELENKSKKVVNLNKYRVLLTMDFMTTPIERGITKKSEKNPSKILDNQLSLQNRINDLYDQLVSNTKDFNHLKNLGNKTELENKTLQITQIEKSIQQLEEQLEENKRNFELIPEKILKDEQVKLNHYLTGIDKEIQELQLRFIKAFDPVEYKNLYNTIDLLKTEKNDCQHKLRVIESKLISI